MLVEVNKPSTPENLKANLSELSCYHLNLNDYLNLLGTTIVTRHPTSSLDMIN